MYIQIIHNRHTMSTILFVTKSGKPMYVRYTKELRISAGQINIPGGVLIKVNDRSVSRGSFCFFDIFCLVTPCIYSAMFSHSNKCVVVCRTSWTLLSLYEHA